MLSVIVLSDVAPACLTDAQQLKEESLEKEVETKHLDIF
jgi:hypothetical protein